MEEKKDIREFIEINDDKEKYSDSIITHYSNGYKKIRIKEQQDNHEILKIWLNNFIEDDFEIIIENKLIHSFYNINQHILDPLKYRSRNIIEKSVIKSDFSKNDLIDKLVKEIFLINPEDLKKEIIDNIDIV